MPFEELTDDQKRIIVTVVERLRTGHYDKSLMWVGTFEGQRLHLQGHEGTPNSTIPQVERTDLHALCDEGYITLTQPGNTLIMSPKQKAYREYEEMINSDSADGDALTSTNQEGTQTDPRTVFVVHGRDEKARRSMFDFLRAIGLNPLEWSQALQTTGKPNPYVGEVLDAAFSRAGAIVVLMTPDDEACLREQFRRPNDESYEAILTGQARANVLFEAGMAMGHFPDQTVLVQLGDLRPFSDIGGRHLVRLDDSTAARQGLVQRLERAGCKVNTSGTDWHTTGNFSTDTEGPETRPATEVEPDKPIGPKVKGEERRDFTIETLDGIMAQFKTRLRRNVEAIYVGKWLQVKLAVKEISEFSSTVIVVLSSISKQSGKDGLIATAHFEKNWGPRLNNFERGDVISVLGRITAITNKTIGLEDCEVAEGL